MAGSFGKAFGRELGKNTAKVVSNAVFGDGWSTPYRRVGKSRSEVNITIQNNMHEARMARIRNAENIKIMTPESLVELENEIHMILS